MSEKKPAKQGRTGEPAVEELEFLFSLFLKGEADAEIREAYQDRSEFPPRKVRWIGKKRKYYYAAKKVLEVEPKSESDPLVIEARKQHFHELCDLIERYEKEINRGFGDGLVSQNHFRLIYFENGGCLGVPLEREVLFECLLNHLQNEKAGELYESWRAIVGQILDKEKLHCNEPVYFGYDPWDENRGEYGELRRAEINARVNFRRALTRVRHRQMFRGKCECCPG